VTIRYTRRALKQLDAILGHIREQSPNGAESVQRRLQEVIDLVDRNPLMGRALRSPGWRRVVAAPYPYLVVYRASQGVVVVHSIRHAARLPSPKLN
jgi:plasmid stabilization system protein ParE